MAAAAEGIMFSLFDLAVRKATDTPSEWVDLPYAMEATYKGSHQVVDIYGDDSYQDSLHFNPKGEITVKCTKVTMAVLEKVTGSTSTSSAGNDEILGGVAGEMSPPNLCLRAKARWIKNDGTKGDAVVTFYKVKTATAFEGLFTLANGKTCDLVLNFTASSSTTDENGAALSEAAFFKLVVPRG
jgi:hypothetical protein